MNCITTTSYIRPHTTILCRECLFFFYYISVAFFFFCISHTFTTNYSVSLLFNCLEVLFFYSDTWSLRWIDRHLMYITLGSEAMFCLARNKDVNKPKELLSESRITAQTDCPVNYSTLPLSQATRRRRVRFVFFSVFHLALLWLLLLPSFHAKSDWRYRWLFSIFQSDFFLYHSSVRRCRSKWRGDFGRSGWQLAGEMKISWRHVLFR